MVCEDVTDQQTGEIDQGDVTGEVQEPKLEPEITLHALTGWTGLRTMHMTATMGSHDVMVLIDSGSTHNFISARLANTLHLPVVPMKLFIVRVANDGWLKCQGRFDKVSVNLQGTKFELTFFSLPLSGLDLVLGIQWLEMLGSVMMAYRVQFMVLIIQACNRYAHFQKEEIEKQVQKMLDFGHIRPSTGPFSSPILLKKKDGSWRFCTNYRALNNITIKDRFPIPTMDDILDELHGVAYFTMFDLRVGYHQARKCVFDQQELEYLGHIITPQGVKVDDKKIATMLAWPRPANISELRGFLGLIGYYRKFVQNYGIIARPLTNLLKKGKFDWHEEAETTFSALKRAMTTTPILAMHNFNDSFTIETEMPLEMGLA
ncbi:putative mitochondrial protein [Vitis vinifera]|uniref:Putative mitochondrial protein n=1 Tax=Vitis vinifera TaxID=29760 RepID=A0A438IWY9_VITVI|nr:putative mitochondrial protein [Vitis vinifera]